MSQDQISIRMMNREKLWIEESEDPDLLMTSTNDSKKEVSEKEIEGIESDQMDEDADDLLKSSSRHLRSLCTSSRNSRVTSKEYTVVMN
jgi:hypothetical protein